MLAANQTFRWLFVSVSFWAQLHTARVAVGQDVTLPDEVRSALLKNAEAITPLTVEWTLQRHSTRTLDDLLKDLGSERYDFYRPETGSTVLDGQKYFRQERVERSRERSKTRFNQEEYTSSFDGEAYFVQENIGFRVCTVFLPEARGTDDLTPEVIRRLGFRIVTGELPQPDILWHLQRGGRLLSVSEVELNGAKHAAIRFAPAPWDYAYWKDREYTYYFDAEKNYAISQIDWSLPGGRKLCTIKNSDWKRLEAPAIWLPVRSSCEWHTWHYCPDKSFDDVFFYEDYTISDLSRKQWPNVKFSPDLKEPGLMVRDPRPSAKSQPGAVWDEDSKKWMYGNTQELPEIKVRKTSVLRKVLIACNVVVFSILGISWWRKRQISQNG